MKGYMRTTPRGTEVEIKSWCNGYQSVCYVPITSVRLCNEIIRDNERLLFNHMKCESVEHEDNRLED